MMQVVRIGVVAAVALAVPTVFAGDAMAVAQQNALVNSLVKKYCAVCHTDATRDGGLSLEHFDAAQVAPSLAAMMVSKLTSGVLLSTVKAAASDANAAALVARKMKSGAMGAAGIPRPDKATVDALIDALASAATGANEWHVNRTPDVVTASILREAPSAKSAGEASMYRLVLACSVATHEGEMQLAWAPAATRGALSAAVDGKTLTYEVDGASIGLRMMLPMKTLRVADLFPNESVEFSFGDLPRTAREPLAGCWQAKAAAPPGYLM